MYDQYTGCDWKTEVELDMILIFFIGFLRLKYELSRVTDPAAMK